LSVGNRHPMVVHSLRDNGRLRTIGRTKGAGEQRMHGFELVLALVVGVAVVSTVARRTGLPAPVLLVVTGLAVAKIPGVPRVELDPDLVLVLILPPLLYSAALNSSLIDFRRNIRPLALMSVGLVLFTAFALA